MITFSDLLSSDGQRFLDRMHYRNFSLNIFRLNARQLLSALAHSATFEQAIHEIGKPEGLAHLTETNRLVHNFVASAITLVEHTRIFMRQHYRGRELLRRYEEEAKRRFEKNANSRLVQQMRNYMVHKGLLPIGRHVSLNRIDGELVPSAGVEFDIAEFLEWKKLETPVRKHLESLPSKVDLLPIVYEYAESIENFQGWVDEQLRELHRNDVVLLEQMKEQFEADRVARNDPPYQPIKSHPSP